MKTLTIKNRVFGEGTPKICIPITGRNEAEIMEAAGRISDVSHDVVEWRADFFKAVSDTEAVLDILAKLRQALPGSLLLFTFRTRREGGSCDLPDADYLALNEQVIRRGSPDLLDLELFTGLEAPDESALEMPNEGTLEMPNEGPAVAPLLALAHDFGLRVILSSHDFKKTPPKETLIHRLSLMHALGGDIAKLAVMPQKKEDVLTLLSATLQASETLDCPLITMSMGPLGVISRISGALFGSCMTFGTAGEASAPGQLEAETLRKALALFSQS